MTFKLNPKKKELVEYMDHFPTLLCLAVYRRDSDLFSCCFNINSANEKHCRILDDGRRKKAWNLPLLPVSFIRVSSNCCIFSMAPVLIGYPLSPWPQLLLSLVSTWPLGSNNTILSLYPSRPKNGNYFLFGNQNCITSPASFLSSSIMYVTNALYEISVWNYNGFHFLSGPWLNTWNKEG